MEGQKNIKSRGEIQKIIFVVLIHLIFNAISSAISYF
jgi:hypothetical protein